MLKRRRENDVIQTDDTTIVDFINETPYLYRSIQAILCMKQTPIIPTHSKIGLNDCEGLIVIKLKSIINTLISYIKYIFDTFFSFGTHTTIWYDQENFTYTYSPLTSIVKIPSLVKTDLYINFTGGREDDFDIQLNFSYLMCNFNLFIEDYLSFYIGEYNNYVREYNLLTPSFIVEPTFAMQQYKSFIICKFLFRLKPPFSLKLMFILYQI